MHILVAEDDPEGFAAFTKAHGRQCQVIGDDFFVTNAARVRAGIAAKAANAVLIKLNQAGTVSETKAAFDAARRGQSATTDPSWAQHGFSDGYWHGKAGIDNTHAPRSPGVTA